jgi:hypothetical protein
MIEASGLFPIELNVPDTVSTMMSGLSVAYDAMSSFFGNGGDNNNNGGEAEAGQTESEVAVNAITRNKRKKKVKRSQKKKINYENFLKLYYIMS